MTSTKKQAVAYCRVSTEGQAADGVSLEQQASKIRAYCEFQGLDLVAVYTDAGISGARSDNRPEFSRALDHVTKTGAALIVYSLSRMSRSVRDTLDIADRLENAGADLVSLSEKIDTTSAAGRMVFKMLSVLAEFERDTIAERTSNALQHKRKLNQRVGTIPYGFDLAADGVALVPNATEQAALQTIRELRAAGESLSAIAAELTRRGITTKTGLSVWSHKSVASILKRTA